MSSDRPVRPSATDVQPVSTQVTRTVPPAKVAAFERLLREVISAARGFEGHLGVDVLRPLDGGCYQIVFRFRDHQTHDAWMGSDARVELVGQIDKLLDDDGGAEVRTVDGWEGWFVAPAYAPPAPPERWKMAAITLAVLYPMVLTLSTALRPVTDNWPRPAGLLLGLALTVPLMTWVVMPALTTRLGSWLRRRPAR